MNSLRRVFLPVGLLVLAAGCTEGVPAIDTDPAEDALASIVEAAGFPDAGTFVELVDCPIVDGELLLDQTFAEAGGDGVDAAAAAPLRAFVSAPNELIDGDPYLACGRLDATTGTGILLLVADAPGDGLLDPDDAPDGLDVGTQWETIVEAYAARFGDSANDYSTQRLRDTRGGTMYEICIAEPDAPERDSCEVAWFGGDLVVSAVTTGPGSRSHDTTAVEASLRRRLQLVVDGLGGS